MEDAPSQPDVVLDIGDQVELEDGRHGQIKFAGHVRFAQGIWYGLALEKPQGMHDGEVKGERYFRTKPKQGLFCQIHHIRNFRKLLQREEEDVDPLADPNAPRGSRPNSPAKGDSLWNLATVASAKLNSYLSASNMPDLGDVSQEEYSEWQEVVSTHKKPKMYRIVVFIRHGHSIWNKLQDNKNPLQATKAIGQSAKEIWKFSFRREQFELQNSVIVDAPLSKLGMRQAQELSERLELHQSLRQEQNIRHNTQMQEIATHIKDAMRAIDGDLADRADIAVGKAPGVSIARASLRLALHNISELMTEVRPHFSTRPMLREYSEQRLPIDAQQVLDTIVTGRDSIVCCSNLRRTISTATLSLWRRFARNKEKLYILSSLQEIGIGVDTRTSLKAGEVPEPSNFELQSDILNPASLKQFYQTRIDAVGNFGPKNEGVEVNAKFRMLDFCRWCFTQQKHTVLAIGHSNWIRTFFSEFLPRKHEHQAKNHKMENCGMLAFRIEWNPNLFESDAFTIIPDTITVLHKGFES